jgi:hypothetical protein
MQDGVLRELAVDTGRGLRTVTCSPRNAPRAPSSVVDSMTSFRLGVESMPAVQ